MRFKEFRKISNRCYFLVTKNRKTTKLEEKYTERRKEIQVGTLDRTHELKEPNQQNRKSRLEKNHTEFKVIIQAN